MRNILVTGSNGFLGKNLIEGLRQLPHVNILMCSRSTSSEELEQQLSKADFIYHLAGINRPERTEDYDGNVELMKQMVDGLKRMNNRPSIVFASTIHAASDNPYGRSKKEAEDLLIRYAEETTAPIFIFRLPNLFGKWCKPAYNSVVATFCHHVSRDMDISISNPDQQIELAYIDHVIKRFIALLEKSESTENVYFTITPTFSVTLQALADQIYAFRAIRKNSILPDLSDPFTRFLYSTYLSYLDRQDFAYPLQTFHDHRGSLFETVKSPYAGQLFVSTTVKGVERGHHYHNTKVEKFCVIKGKAIVKFRNIFEEESFSYTLSDEAIAILDIPPGYTHAIQNISDGDLIVLFWANEIFDANHPDTYPSKV
ncbi:NAD-dependent epimerase/dehydratase family protein [Paenibacillus sinopodophylli]|uniref:polysaccharide biosynthesis C-terminal domain-containing protein n=1 Tax=Paenibacillus sinopodophylli TaxID=1837342 RepID=UPI00110CAD6F|nr:NAD-dependent epimerase/dehydratase family protein [Paenibacillus sinopodophylli]